MANSVFAQTGKNIISGRWKFIKMETGGQVAFDLDHLLETYRQFFAKQKQQSYKGKISDEDSLAINLQFEKITEEVSRMFIAFRPGKVFVTNHYAKDGSLTDNLDSGMYRYDPVAKMISTFALANGHQRTNYKIISISESELVIKPEGANAAILTCKKIEEF